ncbi:MAG: isoamylase early set domain-containing protein [Fidelibacterota bacterium]
MLKKRYLKSRPECKVTFKLDKSYIDNANSVHLVGEMNNWDEESTPMKKLKDGSFKLELNLAKDREYRFRYKVNQNYWINDEAADKYQPSPYSGVDDSVVVV